MSVPGAGASTVPGGEPSDPVELWELFHENSKTSRYEPMTPGHEIVARMREMVDSLEYRNYPRVALPDDLPELAAPFGALARSRSTARGLAPRDVSLAEVAAILEHAYGVTRSNAGTPFPRPFRVIPSGGALYPLEVYLHSARIRECEPGLYHYNPTDRSLRHLRYGDDSRRLSDALVQREIALDASVLFIVTAIFERSTFKYGNRGYRFVLIEAGHLAQNLNLAAGALGLGAVNVGGFFDRQIDDLLGLDGVTHSTVYLCAIGDDRTDPGADATML